MRRIFMVNLRNILNLYEKGQFSKSFPDCFIRVSVLRCDVAAKLANRKAAFTSSSQSDRSFAMTRTGLVRLRLPTLLELTQCFFSFAFCCLYEDVLCRSFTWQSRALDIPVCALLKCSSNIYIILAIRII